jgi:disulfide bond formation protein DsbB
MPLASVISEHLSNPEYLHVLLNPLPVYGLAVGVLGLLLALISRTRAARVVALALIFISAISAWPVYQYGEAAYDRVKSMADAAGDKWLDEHMRRGEQLIYVFYVVAALSAVAVGAEFKSPHAAVPLAIVTALLAGANFGVGVYIAYAGGHVRHREFRFEPAPSPQMMEHHHHAEEQHGAGEHQHEEHEHHPPQ